MSVPRQVPRVLSDARRRFLAANGVVFLLSTALSGLAGELFAARLTSRMPLGIALGALQLAVLLLSSWRYDRTLRDHADPLVDLMRRRAEPVDSSPPRSGPAETAFRRSYPSQRRHG